MLFGIVEVILLKFIFSLFYTQKKNDNKDNKLVGKPVFIVKKKKTRYFNDHNLLLSTSIKFLSISSQSTEETNYKAFVKLNNHTHFK